MGYFDKMSGKPLENFFSFDSLAHAISMPNEANSIMHVKGGSAAELHRIPSIDLYAQKSFGPTSSMDIWHMVGGASIGSVNASNSANNNNDNNNNNNNNNSSRSNTSCGNSYGLVRKDAMDSSGSGSTEYSSALRKRRANDELAGTSIATSATSSGGDEGFSKKGKADNKQPSEAN